MLAGKMKLKHFLILVGLGGAALCGGALLLPVGGLIAANTATLPPAPTPEIQVVTEARAATPVAIAQELPPPVGVNPWDAFLIGKSGNSLGTDKVKDATRGTSYKVNLYQDSGKGTMNRAKVDIDRDDKWDEKWTFEDGNITREVAPNDDENYTQKFAWNGTTWAAQ